MLTLEEKNQQQFQFFSRSELNVDMGEQYWTMPGCTGHTDGYIVMQEDRDSDLHRKFLQDREQEQTESVTEYLASVESLA
uniref:Uncharacterized protein n=1 Tax=Romanomermis culicivorax TaxID=13658 RepID=A0A915KPD5_ROMCU